MNPLARLDWKVVFFAVLGCYVLPWLVLGTLVLAVVPSEGDAGAIIGWTGVYLGMTALIYVIAMPLAGGYFTARFCKNRPQLHVLLVVVLGVLVRGPTTGAPLIAYAIAFAVSLVVAALGAFVALRRVPRA
ncbi:hypothetical protein AAFF27_24850 [Xylophilus sp. GW821-FHT01B05]